jgi:uncharacterized membrane protein
MNSFKEIIEAIGLSIDALGVVAIVAGLVVAVCRYAFPSHWGCERSYLGFRQDIGRGILFGLEFLVAADIIRTVATRFSPESVAAMPSSMRWYFTRVTWSELSKILMVVGLLGMSPISSRKRL